MNWSLDQLAAASGVHRNTISNFETGKYGGDAEKLAAIKNALESSGVIFVDENGEGSGVRLRRFRIGDIVRFRPQTRVRLSFDIAADDVGTVVEVEPHPPQTGPTYRMSVQFARVLVPGVFRFEYELVKAAPAFSIQSFIESGGRPMIPPGNFIANPVQDLPAQLETDLNRLPRELGALILVPTSDVNLRREVDARGFFVKESSQALVLLFRQFPEGVLYTGSWTPT
ncbi:helix-turn-helix transcriptional regulator [Bradyrhizobium prioriisuperbiae]|uniref:helix-turn-helix domain-containing protein n=1 Tax=Bradyrhizobium prioriisuperbiae TaxID=2854389 RepID=UPI0028E452BE|nr:helix-turn-helix transcriptional regulator [Bradyrhizobium prioritasuperba]